MKDRRAKRAAEIQDAIRHVLYYDWDPIGVSGLAPEDEYDSYIPAVYRILVGSRSEQELTEFLNFTDCKTSDLSAESLQKLRQVASKLMTIDVTLDSQA